MDSIICQESYYQTLTNSMSTYINFCHVLNSFRQNGTEIDSIMTIPPKKAISILKFGGIGPGIDVDCCDCYFSKIGVYQLDSNVQKKIVKKDWILINKNKNFLSHKFIECNYEIR
jgi:hypothetical protein